MWYNIPTQKITTRLEYIMNKSQLIKAVAEKSELSQKQVAETWSLIEDTILNTLATG